MSRSRAHFEVSLADGASTTAIVDKTPYLIGSDPRADLHLREPGIRPRHAQVVRLGGVYHFLPDPEAPSPLVGGVPLTLGGIPLSHGLRIELGPAGGGLSLRFLEVDGDSPEREARLITLMEIAHTITSSLKLDEVLERVLEGAVRFSGAQRGFLFLREGDSLLPWTSERGAHSSVDVSLSVATEVARTGHPVYREDLGDHHGASPTSSIVRLGLQAILCVPLTVRQAVIGVVYLDSKRPLPHHRPDLPLLEALAGLAAIAIQNSRLAEEQVRAERTLATGQMARAIVHDLRAPLTSIRGLAELLRMRCEAGHPSLPHLETIITEVDRLTGLTGDLLQFSKGAPPLKWTEVRLVDLVNQTLAPLAARLQRQRVRLALALDEGARVLVDPAKMARVLHNLISNAMDAMPGGGSLSVASERADGRWLLILRDTGCGMPDEVRRRVFDPFYTHGKDRGTGLGMAIVRSIVEEHQGRITVASAPGQGTSVRLELPSDSAQEIRSQSDSSDH